MSKAGTIRAIVVDDEESARNILKNVLIKFMDGVDVVALCADVPSAVKAVNEHQPHVVFLDIEMPNYSGFEFLSFFDSLDFEIIFVSAYGEYALRAFEVSAVDYILKPIEISKVELALQKVRERLSLSDIKERMETLQANLHDTRVHKLALPMSGGLLFVETQNIEYMIADGSYTELHLSNGDKHIISKKLKFFETGLQNHTDFVRVHRSFLVNISKVRRYDKQENTLWIGDRSIKIARDRKAYVESQMKDYVI